MKAFDPNYKLLDEMYQDNYYPAFLVDNVPVVIATTGYTDEQIKQIKTAAGQIPV